MNPFPVPYLSLLMGDGSRSPPGTVGGLGKVGPHSHSTLTLSHTTSSGATTL